MFKIRPGIYVVPDVGRVDASKDVSPEKAVQLYLSKHFPWCEPVIKKETIDFLKKQKLDDKAIAILIQKAKTVEEVDFILEVKSTKTLENLAKSKKDVLGDPK